MSKYTVDVFENWHRKYEIEADSEEDAVEKYFWLKKNWSVNDRVVQEPQYIDDAPSDSWIVERIEDENPLSHPDYERANKQIRRTATDSEVSEFVKGLMEDE